LNGLGHLSRARSQGGFTLVDLLVGLVLTGMLALAIFGIYQVSQNSYAAGTSRAEVQENGRIALERVAGELRGAGYDPLFSGNFQGLTAMAAADVTFTTDLDGDGVLDPSETVRYYVAGGALRRSAGGVDEPLIDGAQTLTFTYLDSSNAPTATIASVRSITIQLTVLPTTTQTIASFSTPATFTTQVRLRNAPIP